MIQRVEKKPAAILSAGTAVRIKSPGRGGSRCAYRSFHIDNMTGEPVVRNERGGARALGEHHAPRHRAAPIAERIHELASRAVGVGTGLLRDSLDQPGSGRRFNETGGDAYDPHMVSAAFAAA
jgi:hypothetical protein